MRTSFLAAGALVLALAACSPQTFTMNVDMRYPSKSGLDLSRRTMSVVYMDNGTADSTFNNGVASALARSLEAEYFGGREAVGVYKVPEDSVSLELMHDLVMDTGDDVVFLIGPPSFGEVALGTNVSVPKAASVDSAFVLQAQIPYSTRLFVYDSMGKEDKMVVFRGGNVLRTPVYNSGVTPQEYLVRQAMEAKDRGADMVGSQISGRFVPTWKTEGFSIYYFEGTSADWTEAAYYAYDYHWSKAADLWMKHVNDRSTTRQACACYNLAVAFLMMGDQDLALRWLDRADQVEALSLSPGLRKRIEARKN